MHIDPNPLAHFFHWFEIHSGTARGGPDPYYNFWSGFGSDLGEVVLIGGLVTLARAHNCHVKGCWRINKHPIEGTPYKVCRKHHPDVPNKGATHAHIIASVPSCQTKT